MLRPGVWAGTVHENGGRLPSDSKASLAELCNSISVAHPLPAPPSSGTLAYMSRHSTFFELVEALDRPGCPLCRLSEASVRRFFASLGHEQVNDVGLRAELRARGGFCQRHAWHFLQASGSRLGVAIVYRDLLHHALAGLQMGYGRAPLGTRGPVARPGFFASLLTRMKRPARSHGPARGRFCLACRLQGEAEARYRSTLLEHLGEVDVRQRYASSQGLCLPHLRRGLRAGGRAEDLDWLRQDAVTRLDSLVGQLGEFIRKHDYRYRKESWGEEQDSPEKAVERAVGSIKNPLS